jgi:hypothetical protein
MAFCKISYLVPSCDGCGLAWSFFDPACAEGIPPHFASRSAALAQLPGDYGWQVRWRRLGRPLMACRTCAAAGVIPAGGFPGVAAGRGGLGAAAGAVRPATPPAAARPPGPRHPESLTAELPPKDEELLAAIEDENFGEL